ncbi:MAG: glycosyltransferase family protein, partial [Bradymonadaceae bacterium]
DAVDYLEERFPEVSEIWGLSLVMEDNEVKKRLTTAKNIREAVGGLPRNAAHFLKVEREFDPDIAISDFETWSWAFAKLHRIPVVGLDNVQAINRCAHDESIRQGAPDDFQMAKSFVKARCPGAAHYLVCSFAPLEVRKPRTTLVPPVLRPRILEAEASEGDHLLVYQSSDSFPEIEQWLFDLDRPVRAYGVRSGLDEPVDEQGVSFRPFSETQFVQDLASCAGVVASAGFTLITEALHLGKPYLATPVGDQFEQLMNARYLEQLGYGMCAEEFDDVAEDVGPVEGVEDLLVRPRRVGRV